MWSLSGFLVIAVISLVSAGLGFIIRKELVERKISRAEKFSAQIIENAKAEAEAEKAREAEAEAQTEAERAQNAEATALAEAEPLPAADPDVLNRDAPPVARPQHLHDRVLQLSECVLAHGTSLNYQGNTTSVVCQEVESCFL